MINMGPLAVYFGAHGVLMVEPTREDMAIKLHLVGRAGESFESPKDYAPYVARWMSDGDRFDADLMATFEENNEQMSNRLRPVHARRYLMARRAFVSLPDDMAEANEVYNRAWREEHAQLSGRI